MKKVTMYTGNPCSFCAAAKALLKTKNVEIEEIDIWADPANAKEMLQRTNGVRTIPQIFIGDYNIFRMSHRWGLFLCGFINSFSS